MIFVPIPNPSKAFISLMNQVAFNDFILMNPCLWEKSRDEQEQSFEDTGRKIVYLPETMKLNETLKIKNVSEFAPPKHVNCRSSLL
jgi:hypothetical protein